MAPRLRGNAAAPTNDDTHDAAWLAQQYEEARQNTAPTVRDELERIARSDTDVGTLAKLLLAGIDDNVDDVKADDVIPEPELREGERRYGGDGNLYEWTANGWVLVDDTPAVPADVTDEDAKEVVVVGDGSTPPVGGSPDAPNTTVSGDSQEGREV